MLTVTIATFCLLLGILAGYAWKNHSVTVLTVNDQATIHMLNLTITAQHEEILDRTAELILAHVLIDEQQGQLNELNQAHDRLWAHYTGAQDEIALRRNARALPQRRGYLAHPSQGSGAVFDTTV